MVGIGDARTRMGDQWEAIALRMKVTADMIREDSADRADAYEDEVMAVMAGVEGMLDVLADLYCDEARRAAARARIAALSK